MTVPSKSYQITEFGKTIETFDPKEFLIDSTIGNVYCLPFDTKDQSPRAKQYSGNSLGTIEWLFEPREYSWSKSEKRYYVTKLLFWATQTRDKRYQNKIFSIDCMSEAISGISRQYYPYEQGAINQTWRMMFSPHTKTPIFDTYPSDNFNLLLIKATSSISLDIKFLRFDLLPVDYPHYKAIWKLHHQKREYFQ